MPKTRSNLVIVRAGDQSLHGGWLRDPKASERSWDLIVSFYGDDPDRFRDQDCIRIDGKGPKGPSLYHFISEHRELLEPYDRILLMDDDLVCTRGDLTRFFACFQESGLDLASHP